MAYSRQLLLAAVFLISVSVIAMKFGAAPKHNLGQLPQPSYDGYVLVTTWAPNACKLKTCYPGISLLKNVFNLRGLWPIIFAKSKLLADCYPSSFDIKLLPEPTKLLTINYWNSLYDYKYSLVSEQWIGRGTCWKPSTSNMALVPPSLKTSAQYGISTFSQSNQVNRQDAYIKMAVSLSRQYNVYEALKAKGIVPTSATKYSRNQVLLAIKSYFGVNKVLVRCEDGYLTEVQICTDLNYKLVDCDMDRDSCPEQVAYMPVS